MERELSIRERVAERRHWVLAVALAGMAALAWCTLIAPVEITGRIPVPEAVRVSYRPVLLQGEELGDNLQAVWSPVLFSLPTHVGFSREMLSSSRVMLPPVQLPEDQFLLTSAPPVLVQNLKERNRSDSVLSAGKTMKHRRKPGGRQAAESVFAATGDASRADVYIRYGRGLLRETFLTNPVHIARADTVKDGVFHISLAPAGYVETVFVDKSSGSTDWDAAVVRSLYTWRAAPGPQKRAGYVTVAAGQHTPETGKGKSVP